jgi:hypothetical protein
MEAGIKGMRKPTVITAPFATPEDVARIHGKSQVPYFFDEILTIMEQAYGFLTKKQFRELEDKIKFEIAFHRRRAPKPKH